MEPIIFTTIKLIEKFWCKVVLLDKKDYKEIDICYIGYVAVKRIGNCNYINSVNSLY